MHPPSLNLTTSNDLEVQPARDSVDNHKPIRREDATDSFADGVGKDTWYAKQHLRGEPTAVVSWSGSSPFNSMNVHPVFVPGEGARMTRVIFKGFDSRERCNEVARN